RDGGEVPPRSPPIPPGILESSLDGPSVPKIPGCRAHATAPSTPSGTSASPPHYTDPLQISPPSSPPASHTLAPLLLPLCTTPPLPPQLRAPNAHPTHIPAYSISADLSAVLANLIEERL